MACMPMKRTREKELKTGYIHPELCMNKSLEPLVSKMGIADALSSKSPIVARIARENDKGGCIHPQSGSTPGISRIIAPCTRKLATEASSAPRITDRFCSLGLMWLMWLRRAFAEQ